MTTPIHAASGQPVSGQNVDRLVSAAREHNLNPAGPWATYKGWRALGRQVPRGCKSIARIIAPRGKDSAGNQGFRSVPVWHHDLTVPLQDGPPPVPSRAVTLDGDAYADGVGVPHNDDPPAPRRKAPRRKAPPAPVSGFMAAITAEITGGDQ